MSQHELSLAEGAIELESPRYSSEAATEVATVVAVLNVPKLAEVLSPPPRPVATREDCAVVAVVWVVPLATDARTGSCGGRAGFVTFTFKLELGPLTRVRRGESGLGGIGACALSGIVSASWNVSLVSESSSESVTKADSLGREDGRTGTLSFLGGSGGGFSGEGTALAFAVFPDEPDADKSLTSLAEVHSPPAVVVVGLSSAGLLDRTVGKLGLGGLQRFAALGVGDTECCSVERLGVDDDAAFDRVPYGLFG